MKITLYDNNTAYFEREAYTICNEPLEIEVDGKYDNLYGICTMGNERKVIKVRDGRLIIPPEFLAPGILYINFRQVENGEPTKRWNVEQVTIRSLDDKYEVIPELVTIKKAIKELYRLVKKNNLI